MRGIAGEEQTFMPHRFHNHAMHACDALLQNRARGSAASQGGLQVSYINVSIFARWLLNRLRMRIYFEDDAVPADDPTLAMVPEDRRRTLIARKGCESGCWFHEIRLRGEREMVFFDI